MRHFPLNVFNCLVQVGNPTLEIAELIKLISKIFWSSISLEGGYLPDREFIQLCLNIQFKLLSGEMSNCHYWRLGFTISAIITAGVLALLMVEWSYFTRSRENWRAIIMIVLYTFVSLVVLESNFRNFPRKNLIESSTPLIHVFERFGDPKLLKPENKPFAQIIQKHFCSIFKSNTYQLLKPQLDIALFEIIFPLVWLNDNDEKLSYDEAAAGYKPYGRMMSKGATEPDP
ncbi:hypothetical protein SUGI_0541720 [Cryptomeria japonica]|nr:hypothetical protein SUGI_0541720 [Cryptomeria japonica]